MTEEGFQPGCEWGMVSWLLFGTKVLSFWSSRRGAVVNESD